MATEIAESGAVAHRQLTANAAPTAKLAANLRARRPSFAVTIARGSYDHAALYLKHLIELKAALACASLGPSLASLYHAPLRLADALLALHAGPERSVAATKSMIASLVAGASLVAHWSEDSELLAALAKLPSILDLSSAAPPSAAVETLAKA